MNYFGLFRGIVCVYDTNMKHVDVIIIGAGIIGCAAARELSRYQISVAVLEKEYDTGFGTSSRNSGVVHSGIHYRSGTLRAIHAVRGNHMMQQLCEQLQVPFKPTGKLTVAFDRSQCEELKVLKAQGEANGVPGLEIIDVERMQRLQPGISGIQALYSPSTAIISPYELTIACAESAHHNGVEFHFGHTVSAIDRAEDGFIVHDAEGLCPIHAAIVINAAGLYADSIAQMAGIQGITIYPCKGEYYVLDKRLGDQLDVLIYPVPGHHSSGLGIHLTQTVDGNILIGPSTAYSDSKEHTGTTSEILRALRAAGHTLLPTLSEGDFIRTFAGLRPKLNPPEVGGFGDFILEDHDRFILLAGIESPGLTAAPSLALEIVALVRSHLSLVEKQHWSGPLPARERFLELPLDRQQQLVEQDPDHGSIVCRCEGITKAEVLQAVDRIIGPVTYTGIKLRCRSMMGRCQGGFCIPRIAQLLEEERGITMDQQQLKGPGSPMYHRHLRPEESTS